MLKRKRIIHQVIVSSRFPAVLRRFRELNQNIKLGYIVVKPGEDYVGFAKDVGAYSLHPYKFTLSRKMIEAAKKNDLKVFVWTVNAKSRMKKYIRLGVDGIVTDFPNVLHKVIEDVER